MLRLKSALSAVLFATLANACSKKVPECNALVKQLNDSSTAMEAANTALMGDPKQAKSALDKFAATTKTEAEKIAKVELSVPELRGFAKKYEELLNETMQAATAIAKTTGDAESVESAVTKSRDAWMAATTKLGTSCIKGRNDCVSLGDKVMKPPGITGASPTDDAQKLEDYAKGIAADGVKNADVKAAVAELKKASGEFASALRRFGSAKEEDEKARKALNEAGAKEPALVKSINDFCQGG